jgi:acyl-CoA thioesterase I
MSFSIFYNNGQLQSLSDKLLSLSFTALIFLTTFFLGSDFLLSGAHAETKALLFFGDSLTAGFGVEPEEAFPALIGEMLNSDNFDVKVINAGVSGDTSAGGLRRIDWVLRQPLDLFVLELGANDGLRGIPPATTKKNLSQIIEKVKLKYPSAKLVVAGMRMPRNFGEPYRSQFEKVFTEVAEENDATLIPFLLEGVALNRSLNITDGIHPNAGGHKIIAEKLFPALREVLAE